MGLNPLAQESAKTFSLVGPRAGSIHKRKYLDLVTPMPKTAAAGPDLLRNSRMVELVAISDLVVSAHNARHHPRLQLQKLAKLIARFGIVVPVLIDETNTILDGHGVVEAAKLNGATEVPVLRVENLSEAEKRALRLALNRISEDGDWDREKLAAELHFLIDEKFDLALTSFEVSEID